jgi:hypothetical protein
LVDDDHGDSVFIICATVSQHFSSGSERIQRLCKPCFATATSSLHFSSTLMRSAGIAWPPRENARRDSQPRFWPKRTESGLPKNCTGLSSST